MNPHEENEAFWIVIAANYPRSVGKIRSSETYPSGPVNLIAYARYPLPEHEGLGVPEFVEPRTKRDITED